MKTTKIILSEDVYNLGEEGDIKEVAPGYARNFLIPKGMAVPYSRRHVALFADRRAAIERRKEEKRQAALGLKERIESLSIVFKAPAGDSGKLFGSVSNAAIADRLLQEGFQIERKKIEVPGHAMKMVGEYDVTVKLYANEAATLKVVIEAIESSESTAARSRSRSAAELPDATAQGSAAQATADSDPLDEDDDSAEYEDRAPYDDDADERDDA
jgi:large subunit ribosomal protein L9